MIKSVCVLACGFMIHVYVTSPVWSDYLVWQCVVGTFESGLTQLNRVLPKVPFTTNTCVLIVFSCIFIKSVWIMFIFIEENSD